MGTLDILTKGLAAKPFQSITNKLRIKNILLTNLRGSVGESMQ